MYRALIERGDKTRELLASIVKEQHFPDGTYINVSGKNVLSEGRYSQVLDARDPEALKARLRHGLLVMMVLKLRDTKDNSRRIYIDD